MKVKAWGDNIQTNHCILSPPQSWVFLGVVETIAGLRLCCDVSIIGRFFPIFCITSFGDCTCPQNQETNPILELYLYSQESSDGLI